VRGRHEGGLRGDFEYVRGRGWNASGKGWGWATGGGGLGWGPSGRGLRPVGRVEGVGTPEGGLGDVGGVGDSAEDPTGVPIGGLGNAWGRDGNGGVEDGKLFGHGTGPATPVGPRA
jgi:hypothetical protein